MSNLGCRFAHHAWMLACAPAHSRLQKALFDPRAAQLTLLQNLLQKNGQSVFGHHHRFSKIKTVHDFQEAVPCSTYDSLLPWIERIRQGEPAVLTQERVLMFERSSGSTAACKYIPYTASLRQEFQRAIRAWMYNLYRSYPALRGGRSYWLITPLSRQREMTPGGTPVGFETDAEYLGVMEQWLTRQLFAVPAALAQVGDLDASLNWTLRFLLQTPDLRLISVWNPSYLTLLMERLHRDSDLLLRSLSQGTMPLASSHSPVGLEQQLVAMPQRARHLRQILESQGQLMAQDIWPQLQLVSCWTAGAARHCLPEMQSWFSGVQIQGKGLLATEGIVTIPWPGTNGAVPTLHSHFYEFIEDGSQLPCLVHELETGKEYGILLTTGGGLWRYRLGDKVRVVGKIHHTPTLEFIGREDGVSDLRGEKLNPVFVDQVLSGLLRENGLSPRFAIVAPVLRNPSGYALFIETHALSPDFIHELDQRFRSNPHYAHARDLGQLGEPQVFLIRQGAQETYLRRCETLGQRTGSIKPTSLHRSGGWEDFFTGSFVQSNPK